MSFRAHGLAFFLAYLIYNGKFSQFCLTETSRPSASTHRLTSGLRNCTHEECYGISSKKIKILNELSMEALRKASSANHHLLSHIRLESVLVNRSSASGEQYSPRYVEVDLSDLDSKLAIVGNKAIEYKHLKDRLNYLVDETNQTALKLVENRHELDRQRPLHDKTRIRLQHFQFKLQLEDVVLKDVSSSLTNLKWAHLAIQELVPREAMKLIENNHFRSKNALSDVLTNSTLLNKSSIENLISPAFVHEDNQFTALKSEEKICTDEAEMSVLSAKFLAERAYHVYDNYQAKFDMRSMETTNAKLFIDETRQLINLTNHYLSQFSFNVSSIMRSIPNSTKYSKVIENATQLVTMSLDKIDTKMTTAKAEVEELTRVYHEMNITNKVFSLKEEIGQLVDQHITQKPNWLSENFTMDDLKDCISLNTKAKALATSLGKTNIRLMDYSTLKQSLERKATDTQILNSLIAEQTSNLMKRLDSQMTGRDLSAQIRDLNATLRSRLDRIRSLVKSSIGQKIVAKHRVEVVTRSLEQTIASGRSLRIDLESRYEDASNVVAILSGQRISERNVVTNIESRKRYEEVIKEIKIIGLMLHKNTLATHDLGAQFKMNQEKFTQYSKTLEFLHIEMDKANNDLERKIQWQQSC